MSRIANLRDALVELKRKCGGTELVLTMDNGDPEEVDAEEVLDEALAVVDAARALAVKPAEAPAPAPAKAKRKSNSRTARWHEAVQAARAALEHLESAKGDLEGALEDLKAIQEEYQEWRDNLTDGLDQSPVAEKLDAVTGIDLDLEVDTTDVEGALDEAEGADLPLGFGRD